MTWYKLRKIYKLNGIKKKKLIKVAANPRKYT